MTWHQPLHFGDCVVNVQARTVVRGGKALAFEPKVFDTLVYLIAHRDRVVAKPELLENIWGRRVVVSEGAIARTIMKVRRLLGDAAGEAALVRTIHRVGYRFAAEVTMGAPVATAVSLHADSAPGRSRVAVLPCVDRTGCGALAWVDLGLMTLTGQALHDAGVAVADAAEVLTAIGTAAGRSAVAAVGVLATDVLQTTLSSRDDGSLSLRWEGHGRTLEAQAGELSGSDPIEICRRLVSQLVPRLGAGVATNSPVSDPYLQSVRARAQAAIDSERWESARRLLQVALDHAPDDLSLQLDLARCLVQLRDADGQPLLERLLRAATAVADTRQQRRCLQMLARCRHDQGDDGEAEQLLARALVMAEAEHDRQHQLQLLQSMAELSAAGGRSAIGGWLLDRAAALAQALEDPVGMARTLDTRGRLAAANGDRDAALRHFDGALGLQRMAGVTAGAAHTLTHLGDLHQAFGRIGTARHCFGVAFEMALASGDPTAIAIAGLNLGRNAGTSIGHDDVALGIVARMRALDSRGRAVIDSHADLLDAWVQARAGRLEACLYRLDRAEALHGRRNFRLRVRRLRTLVLAASGCLDEAHASMREFHDGRPCALRSQIVSIGRHLAAVCAHAAGDAALARRHLGAAIAAAPHSLWRLEMMFDAAWLAIEAGEGGAQGIVGNCRSEFEAALADGHAPALVLRARQYEAAGDAQAAAALRARCPLPPGAACAWNDRPSGVRLLPSLASFAASLQGLQRPRRAAA